jgi:hypothetical protein
MSFIGIVYPYISQFNHGLWPKTLVNIKIKIPIWKFEMNFSFSHKKFLKKEVPLNRFLFMTFTRNNTFTINLLPTPTHKTSL